MAGSAKNARKNSENVSSNNAGAWLMTRPMLRERWYDLVR